MSAPLAFLFGDSHTHALAKGAKRLGLSVVGAGTMRGLRWDAGAFELAPDGVLSVHEEGQDALSKALAKIGVRSLFELRIPIVTTVAFTTNRALDYLGAAHTLDPKASDRQFISRDFFAQAALERRRKILEMLARLRDAGQTVVVSSSPPRVRPVDMATAFEEVILRELDRLGLPAHHTRLWAAAPDGELRPEFVSLRSHDLVHANPFYGAQVWRRIAPLAGFGADIVDQIERGLADPARFA